MHRWNAEMNVLIGVFHIEYCFITTFPQQLLQKGLTARAACLHHTLFFNTRHRKLNSASICFSLAITRD